MDWDAAYSNASAVEGAGSFPPGWLRRSEAFLADDGRYQKVELRYGSASRERLDLFHPDTARQGVLVFVHGGYWHKFDKSYWSWLAAGPLSHGWSVAIAQYTLCPAVRISAISRQIAAAVTRISDEVAGPIRLAGHSAGGHLVTRLMCPGLLATKVARRITGVTSISGLHDLRPLLATKMNQTLCLDPPEAEAESPALHAPAVKAELTCWVGSAELPEFLRQNRLLSGWRAHGVPVTEMQAPGRHHFDVI
ncbi:MAG: alpha/beta hydrolase, partial [Pseudomonadota bacterium]